jgi:chromosome segregation ATPase
MQISDALSTLKKVSEILHQVKKSNGNSSAYGTYTGQYKSVLNRKSLNSTMQKGGKRTAQSIKPKQAKRMSIVEDESTKKDLILNLKSNLKREKKGSMIERFAAINETFSEVIELSNEYKAILKQIQSSMQHLFGAYNDQYKQVKDNYERSQVELLKAKTSLDSLQSENEKLKTEIESLKEKSKQEVEKQRKVYDDEIKVIKNQANKKIREVSHDLAVLYNENKELTEVAESLYAELQQSKDNKKVVKKLIKVNSKDNVPKKTKISEVKVGKNNVKVPTLDLSTINTKKETKLKVVEYCKDGESENNSNEGSVEESNMESEELGIDYLEYEGVIDKLRTD